VHLLQNVDKDKGDGQFNNPVDVVTDSAGFVCVTDFINRVQKLTNDGLFVAKLCDVSNGNGCNISDPSASHTGDLIKHAWGIAVDSFEVSNLPWTTSIISGIRTKALRPTLNLMNRIGG
jgi:hypothetical protein